MRPRRLDEHHEREQVVVFEVSLDLVCVAIKSTQGKLKVKMEGRETDGRE